MGSAQHYVSAACNNAEAVRFVMDHRADCEYLARQLAVPLENVLGLAAEESQWGTGRIARECNNYFSMHAPAPLQVGEEQARRDSKTKVAKFASFKQGGESFVRRYGDAVRGMADPIEFAKALKTVKFNSGDSKTGGRNDFVEYLAGIIGKVGERLQCPSR